LLAGSVTDADVDAPVYFMTEDQISRGLRHVNRFTGVPYEPVGEPCKVESVVCRLPAANGDDAGLWKLNHYYDRLVDWQAAHGIVPPLAGEPVAEQWELHALDADPEERTNLAGSELAILRELQGVLDDVRACMRRVPSLAARAT
jgi:hypothetical protein